MRDPTISAEDARRELAGEVEALCRRRLAAGHDNLVLARMALSIALANLIDENQAIILAALCAEPARGAEEMSLRPDVLAAAWGAWRVRHPHERLGPGPGFREAIAAAIRALPLPQGNEGGEE